METDIENKIIPKDVILGRMCNDKMPGAVEEVNGDEKILKKECR